MKKLNLLSVLLCAGAITLAGCNNGGGGNTKRSGSSAPTSGQTTSGTSGTSGSDSGSSSTSSTPVKTDWTDAEKAVMRQALDGEVLPFFKGEWGWEVDQSGHLIGGTINVSAAELKQAFAGWLIVSESAAQLVFQKDSAHGEANLEFEFAGSSVSLEGYHSVGWPIVTKQLMRSLLNGMVLPYAEAWKDMVWSADEGSLVGTIPAATFSNVQFYNMSSSLGLSQTGYEADDGHGFEVVSYAAYAEDAMYEVVSKQGLVSEVETHILRATYIPAATAWTTEDLALMNNYIPEPFPFVKAANWSAWDDEEGYLRVHASAVQVTAAEVLAGAVAGGYRFVMTSSGYTYFEKILSADKTLIEAQTTTNNYGNTFIFVDKANTPTASDWSTANKAIMSTLFGEGVYLPFPGESWYEGTKSNNTLYMRGVEIDATKAAAIADFFEAEGYDVAADPEYPESDYLMCKEDGAGHYFNISFYESPSRQTYFLAASLGNKPCVDRTTFEISSSSNEVEIGDTFTVSVTRGNFVEGEALFSTSNDAAVEIVDDTTPDEITYRVVAEDPAFEVTAQIGDGSEFTDTIAVALVPVTWSADYKALMRENFAGHTLPYAESIKDMVWAVNAGKIYGMIQSSTADLATVRTVYEDDAEYTYLGEQDGVYYYGFEEDITGFTKYVYTVGIYEDEGIVTVEASYSPNWTDAAASSIASYAGYGISTNPVLPYFPVSSYATSGVYLRLSTSATQAQLQALFEADANWAYAGAQSGSIFYYGFSSIYGYAMVEIEASNYVWVYANTNYRSYMVNNLDGTLLPAFAGNWSVGVQTGTVYGYIADNDAASHFAAFVSGFESAGWSTMALSASNYFIAKTSTNGNGVVKGYVYADEYQGQGYLNFEVSLVATISEWSDDDKAVMSGVLGEGVVLPDAEGAWEAWAVDTNDSSVVGTRGYLIDVAVLESALAGAGFSWDVDNDYYTKDVTGGTVVVTINDYAGDGTVVDLTAQLVSE